MQNLVFEYLFLGIFQGIFEWLPISSQGIVVLVSQFLAIEINFFDFALFVHLGTFFCVVIYFFKDWRKILFLKDVKLLKFLIISTFVSLAVGFPLYKLLRGVAFGPALLLLIGLALILTAFFQTKFVKLRKTKPKLNEIKPCPISSNSLAIGLGFLQGLSVIPGLSRSGATIFGLSLANFKPFEILKISYLMSGPVVLASSIYLYLSNSDIIFKAWPSLISSFVIGLVSLHFLMKISQKINFFYFTLSFGLLCLLGGILGLIM